MWRDPDQPRWCVDEPDLAAAPHASVTCAVMICRQRLQEETPAEPHPLEPALAESAPRRRRFSLDFLLGLLPPLQPVPSQ